MALFYITGTSGSGKSSICDQLEILKYDAYDTDVSMNDWYDRETGQIVEFVAKTPHETTMWVQSHDFLMSENKVKQLAANATNKDIFICGHASNDIDLLTYFSKIFCLYLNEDDTRKRLSSRTNNTWGNDPEQLDLLMKWYKPTLQRYQEAGAIMIDATRSVKDVVADILKFAKS
jgi:shikimate kinase